MTDNSSNEAEPKKQPGEQDATQVPSSAEFAAHEPDRRPSPPKIQAGDDEVAGEPGQGASEDSPAVDPDDYWADEDDGFDDEPAEEAPDSGAVPDARTSVEAWHVLSVGHRPKDFMARDCLFGSLFRDHRVPWFRRYVHKPSPWMESLVGHLPDMADRTQALRYVALHFLHKLHLARLMSFLSRAGELYEEVDPRVGKTLRRLWNCTPYGVEVEHVGHPGRPLPGCNLARLCPWCHARKVAQLYEVLSRGPLRRREVQYLFLGKATPFVERMGGVDGSYRQADWDDYARGGSVRGHWGRYFGRDRARLAHTRAAVVECLMIQAHEIGLGSGLWTHQLGSAQLDNGQRTFLHDLALIAEADGETIDRMPRDEDGKIFWGGWKRTGLPAIDAGLEVLWLPLPLDRPAALRVALAGSSVKYAVSRLELPQEWFGSQDGPRSGIRGALSWQPTISFDDQMWFAYAQAVKNQQLYHPFGTWKESMALAAAVVRSSIDRRFRDAQAERFEQDRQQKGNRQRSRAARDRRAELFKVALEVWPQVLTERTSRPGRPGRRKRLAELLHQRGLRPSRRDLEWLMNQLGSRGAMPSG